MRDIFFTWFLRCTLTVISSLFLITTAKSQELEDYEGRWLIMTRDGYGLFGLSQDSLKVFESRGYDTSTFTLDHSAQIDSSTLDATSVTIQLGSHKEPFFITFKPLDTQTGKSVLMSGREQGDSISFCDT